MQGTSGGSLHARRYHHALHGRFYHARDLIQLSGVTESVQSADILTLILYNRALVMVGLAAFRLGKLHDALYSLMEVGADLERG